MTKSKNFVASLTPTYRTSDVPLPCSHEWERHVVHYNFEDPDVLVQCRKCRQSGTKFQTFRAFVTIFGPRILMGYGILLLGFAMIAGFIFGFLRGVEILFRSLS